MWSHSTIIAHLEITEKVPLLLERFKKETEGISKPFGILLSQKYTRMGLTPENLKGMDADIYSALQKIGKTVEIVPVVLNQFRSYFPYDEQPFIRKNVYLFNNEAIAFVLEKGPKPQTRMEIPFVSMGGGQLLHEKNKDRVEYAGNESSEDVLNMSYLHSALIIH